METYERASMEIICFETEDVITTSTYTTLTEEVKNGLENKVLGIDLTGLY